MPLPKQYVPCACGRPDGWPNSGRCMKCMRAGGVPSRKKYHWTPERDRIVREAWIAGTNKAKLSEAIGEATRRLAVPRYIVRFRAAALGLTRDTRRPWLAAERQLVEAWAGSRSLNWIVKQLPGRSLTGLRSYMERHSLSRRLSDGCTLHDVAELFGVSFVMVQRWRDQGLLTMQNDRVAEESLRKLLIERPELYSLRRVDEAWFKAMVFPRASCFRIASPQTFSDASLQQQARKRAMLVQSFAGGAEAAL